MIKILAHRGFWDSPEEKNSVKAFEKAIEYGFGIETDIRDYNGKLVISHDVPDSNAMSLESFFDIVSKNADCEIAVNVKSDGLFNIANQAFSILDNPHFYFDMSIPDTLGYAKNNLRFFTRYSDIELYPCLLDEASGVWLDNFSDNVLAVKKLLEFLEVGKYVALVSPELHGYDYSKYWQCLRNFTKLHSKYLPQIMLCTDYPTRAKEFFYE